MGLYIFKNVPLNIFFYLHNFYTTKLSGALKIGYSRKRIIYLTIFIR